MAPGYYSIKPTRSNHSDAGLFSLLIMHADNETPCLSLWQGSATAVKVCFYRTLILLHVILLKCGIVAGQQMTKVNRFFVVKVFAYKKSKKMLFETR